MYKKIYQDLYRSWSQHRGLLLSAGLVLTATFSFIFVLLTFLTSMNDLLQAWGKEASITVYLKDNLSSPAQEDLKKRMEKLEGIQSLAYVSQEQAKSSFTKDMKQALPELVSHVEGENPFPASYQLHLHEELLLPQNNAKLSSTVEKIKGWPQVEDVSYGQDWVQNYSALLSVAKKAALFLLVVLSFASLLIIGNGLNSVVSKRRSEIEILELVGATTRNICQPFIVEGVALSLLSGLCGLVFSLLITSWLRSVLEAQLAFFAFSSHFKFISLPIVLLLLVLCMMIGLLGSWWAVRRINTGWSASERLTS